jgi:predicted phosphate transport protein (TIGR00153 family)
MLRLIPRDDRYFDRFTDLAVRVHEAARTLDGFFSGDSTLPAAVERVKQLEHECDEISHEILRRIDRTFITPIDRDDIHRLAVRLDDVIDLIDGTARRLNLYKLTKPTDFSRQMSDVVVRITAEMVQGVERLAGRKGVIEHCIAIKKLENEGDVSYHDAVAALFAAEIPVLDVIKWKDIYENLERSVDACEAVAHILESTVWKSS